MVTHFRGHWDKLPNNETRYTKTMLRTGMDETKLTENTRTVFIKINEETHKPEKVWVGWVSAFRPDSERIRFRVNIEKEIPCPKKYYNYREGWYFEAGTGEGGDEQQALSKVLDPPFLQTLQTTNDWKEFELYSNWLIRLVGVHEIHKFEEQKGKADGFFKFNNLAVMYDCTLQDDFQTSKRDQITNYCNQLKIGKVEIKDNIIDISHCKKQVWIITRGEAKVIRKIDEVIVREVPVAKIIAFYKKRFDENLNEDELADLLARTD
jgi:hypothetical protein